MHTSFLLRQVLLSIHLIGLAFGLGAATVADISFARALKMGDRISPETVAWMRLFSKLVWLGMAIMLVSGVGLFALQPSTYLASAGFLAKMIFVSILIINGLFLNFYTTARLTTFNFSELYQRRDAAWRARKLSFVFGAISTVTWYSTLFVAQFKSYVHFTVPEYLLLYFFALLSAVIGSLILEQILHVRFSKLPMTLDRLSSSAPIPDSLKPSPTTTATPTVASPTPAVVPAAPITDTMIIPAQAVVVTPAPAPAANFIVPTPVQAVSAAEPALVLPPVAPVIIQDISPTVQASATASAARVPFAATNVHATNTVAPVATKPSRLV